MFESVVQIEDDKTSSQISSSNVFIKPSSVELAVDGNINLVLYLESESGHELKPDHKQDSLKWESSNSDIVEVDDFGTITGKSIGKAKISLTATIDDLQYNGSVPVNVQFAEIREININPYLVMLAKEDEKILDLYATDNQGNPKSLVPEYISYQVSDNDYLSVEKLSNGQPKLVSGNKTGHAFVTVSYLGISGQPLKINISDNVLVEPNSTDNIGKYNSLFVTKDNHVNVAYYNETKGSFKYAYWGDKVWRNETVIQLAFLNAGQDARILVSGGIPYIAFYESNNRNIKILARKNGVWAEAPPLEEQGFTGPKTSFVLKNGHPSIAYQFSEDHSDSNVIKYSYFVNNRWVSNVVTNSQLSQSGFDLKVHQNKIGLAYIDEFGYVSILESHDNAKTWINVDGLSKRVEQQSYARGSVSLNYCRNGNPHLSYYVPGGGVQFAKPSQSLFGKTWAFAVLDSHTTYGGKYLDGVIDCIKDRISFYDSLAVIYVW